MRANTAVRVPIGALIVSAVGVSAWIISLPNQAECRASGRAVDPAERHCASGTGYQQRQGHATFHAVQVALGGLVILAGASVVRRVFRRLAGRAPPAA